ncbi:MAG: hypothetical protein ACXABY_06720 [Candidatus Thorarchaeota archaeon]|jgi:hypothetical protein
MIVLVLALSITIWHDGMFRDTSIRDINAGEVEIGSVVTVKGPMYTSKSQLADYRISVYIDRIYIGDQLPQVSFLWNGDVPANRTIVIVTGTLNSIHSLVNVTYFQPAWLFPWSSN